jgi:dephospho-CoA kinase
MLRLGLTGGIASGKSAVAAMLRELGFAVLDADSLAHKLIEPGQPAYNEVLQEFGPSITDPSGRIDRSKLSVIVFADRAKLDRLNAIVHPRVAEVLLSQLKCGVVPESAMPPSSKPRSSSKPVSTRSSMA